MGGKGKDTGEAEKAAFEPGWLDAGPDRARAFVEEARERAALLVEAWVAEKNAAAVAEIAADDGAPAAARKAARRGLQVLKSRGVSVPERARVARVSAAAFESHEAWFRAPDGAGTSALTLAARTATGRYRLVDVILRSGAGVVSVANMDISRSQLRETFAQIEKRFRAVPVPVPVAWARAKVAAARAENDRAGTVVPLGFDTHADLLGPVTGEPPSHPADGAALTIPDRATAVARSAKLHAEPELRGWLPDPLGMERLVAAVRAASTAAASAAPISEEGVAEARARAETQIKEAIAQETDRFFSDLVRDDFANRMRDAAIPMIARGARDRAADLLATAAQVRSLAVPPHTIPFLSALFEKAFGLLAARWAAKAGVPPPELKVHDPA
jgi:hypothetical protein